MKRLGCVRDDEGIWLVEAVLPEAHGANGWTFPETTREGRELIRWHPRGDVLRDEVVIVELEREHLVEDTKDAQHFSHSALHDAWTTGRMLLAPWAAALASGARPKAQAWQVVPHVAMLPVRTPTLPPATHTNTFLVGDEDEVVLVEPAPIDPHELALMEAWARSHPARVVAVFATHHHHDHVGGIELAERLGVPIWAHAETASRIRPSVDRTIVDDERVQVGSVELRALHTPGHAPGHLCLLEEASGTLIAGDMVAGVGTILVEPSEGDMTLYLRSLERLRDLEVRFVLPAHGGVIANPREVFQHYIDHRLQRERSVVDALSDDPQTIQTMLPKVYGDVPRAVWPLASLSLRAHLDKLIADGKARVEGEGFSLRSG